MHLIHRFFWLLAIALMPMLGHAQERAVQQALMKKVGDFPPIKSVTQAPIKGLYEVVTEDLDIFYTDAQGNFLIKGDIVDTKTLVNLTEARLDVLTAVPFMHLPLKDAITFVRGNGQSKVAVFADPNCGYCKHFEADLLKINNITVYLYLMPVLGPDSTEKSKHLWCAKDKGKAWLDWMLKNIPPSDNANCDTSALGRNLALGKRYKITGTPTIIFANGTRTAGALAPDRFERMLRIRS